jgi:cob(I)alamin adenosyltransferase
MARIYTKTGDDGTTGLADGKRVYKDDLRMEASGSVDELNALLGILRVMPLPLQTVRTLLRVQNDLFSIGAELTTSRSKAGSGQNMSGITNDTIEALEVEIDERQKDLPPLNEFILPGGGTASAYLHFARTVARRTERSCVSLARTEHIDPRVVQYLNRLSDLLFVMARQANQADGQAEAHPTFIKRAGPHHPPQS